MAGSGGKMLSRKIVRRLLMAVGIEKGWGREEMAEERMELRLLEGMAVMTVVSRLTRS